MSICMSTAVLINHSEIKEKKNSSKHNKIITLETNKN